MLRVRETHARKVVYDNRKRQRETGGNLGYRAIDPLRTGMPAPIPTAKLRK